MLNTVKSRFINACLFLPAALLVLSVLFLVMSSFRLEVGLWSHLTETLFFPALGRTLLLAFSVSVGTLILGLGLAIAVQFFEFPGKNLLDRLLVLPIALPGYVYAFVVIGLLDYAGPVKTAFREAGMPIDFLEIRSFAGLIIVFSLALYPYVYLLSREGFRSQGPSLYEAAFSLGYGLRRALFKLSIPAALPWIVGGLSLVMMEALADFGVVSAFNFQTLTVLVYRTWTSFFSLAGASQIALIHLALIIAILFGLRRYTRKGRHQNVDRGFRSAPTFKTSLAASYLLSFGLWIFFGLVFVVPVGQLFLWSLERMDLFVDERFLSWTLTSFSVASAVAVLVILFTLSIRFFDRVKKSRLLRYAGRISSLGYAFPGTVLAVSLLVIFTWTFGPLGRVSAFALIAMTLALLLRFFSVGFQPISKAYRALSPNIDEASQSLGVKGFSLFRFLHWPLIRLSVAGGFLFVFLDTLKEMPIQVMMAPSGWDTLSSRIYEYTAEGLWKEAAVPSLVLVLVALVPTWLMSKKRMNLE